MSLIDAAEALLHAVEDSGHKSDVMSACNALREALAEHPGDGAEHFHRVVSQLGKAACRVDDLVTLCRRLCRTLKHIAPTHPLLAQVDEYMRREGLTGLPLREALAEAEKVEPVLWGSFNHGTWNFAEEPEAFGPVDSRYAIPLYTHPPSRE